MSKTNKLILCAVFLSFNFAYGQDSDPTKFSDVLKRVVIKHKEFNGVGYDSGYTSLDLFFAKSFQQSSLNFLDLRTHVLNTGSFALNAGLGWRYLINTKTPVIFGVNGYYDYRLNHNLSYNQIALGFEALNSRWEARVNGYLPLGAQGRVDTSLSSEYQPLNFQGHYLLVGQNNRSNSLGEIDSEFGVHFWPTNRKDLDLYVGAGPYYLQIPHGGAAAGVAARVAFSMSRYITATGTYSYDRFYKSIGQGEVSFNIPLGKEEAVEEVNSLSDLNLAYFLNERFSQDVYRQEIIPTKTAIGGITYAIDPRTNNPYYFVFVDNTSNSAGTFESPYPTLLEAQNNSSPYDVIYVYPGDGTSKGMDTGIVLQANQWLFGASVTHPIPVVGNSSPIVIPSYANARPIIKNSSGIAIELADNNVISGFFIPVEFQNGIDGENVSNPVIEKNIIRGYGDDNSTGIFIKNSSGSIHICNNEFSDFNFNTTSASGFAILSDDDVSISQLLCLNNTFSDFNCSNGAVDITAGGIIYLAAGTIDEIIVQDCFFNNFSIKNNSFPVVGLVLLLEEGRVDKCIVDRCMFENSANGTAFHIVGIRNGSLGLQQVTNCTFSNLTQSSTGINFIVEPGYSGGIDSVVISANIFEAITDLSAGISGDLNGDASRFIRIKINDNNFSGYGSAGWAMKLDTKTGTTCLSIVDNLSIPLNSPPNQPIKLSCETGAVFQVESADGAIGGVEALNNGVSIDVSTGVGFIPLQFVPIGNCP